MDHTLAPKKIEKEFNMTAIYLPKNIARYIFSKIKKVGFVAYELFLPRFTIDQTLVSSTIEEFGLQDVTAELKSLLNKVSFEDTDNVEYSDNMLTWVGADKHFKNNPLFLNPPNVAVIDFLLKNVQKDAQILDYGTGLGNLLVYLRQLGFVNSFGYDNFSQFRESTIRRFLANFDLSEAVLTKDQVFGFKTKVLVCISYFWSRLEKDLIEKEISNPDLEYILLDHYYASYHIKHFKIMGIYKNLLIVFKRIS